MSHYLRNYYWAEKFKGQHAPFITLCGKTGVSRFIGVGFPDNPDKHEYEPICETCTLIHFANPEQTESWYRYKEGG